MRRIVVVLLLVWTFCSALEAQRSTYPRSLWVGVRGGISFSRYMFVPSVTQSMYQGKSVGLSTRWDLEKGASLQVELNYVETGWKERFDDVSLASQRRLRYVEMPLLTHLYLGTETLRFFVNIGPFVGYRLSDEHIATGSTFTDTQLLRQTMPIKHSLAWGLTGGPGISLLLGKRHRLEVDARISYNFQDVWGNSLTDAYSQSTELRMAGSIAYHYRF